jgi:hypothetical protein
VVSADIVQRVPHALITHMYVFYQWHDQHKRIHNGTTRYLWTANAMASRHPEATRGNAFMIANMAIEITIAYKDSERSWKQKGIDLTNETLDNLVMLFAIQNQREFETESRLSFIPLT